MLFRSPRGPRHTPDARGDLLRHRDDVLEIKKLLRALGITVNVVAPLDARPSDIARLGEAAFNVVLYPEIAHTAAQWLERAHGQPFTRTIPIGVGATRDFLADTYRPPEIQSPARPHAARQGDWRQKSAARGVAIVREFRRRCGFQKILPVPAFRNGITVANRRIVTIQCGGHSVDWPRVGYVREGFLAAYPLAQVFE